MLQRCIVVKSSLRIVSCNITLKQRRRRRQLERQKSSRTILAKQKICTCITHFCTFLCRRCTNITWKCLISRFVGDGNTKKQLFSLLGIWYSPLEFNSKKFADFWWIKRDGISAIRFKAARIHFLSGVFVAVAVFVASGDVTRDDSQRRFLAQQSVATLFRMVAALSQHCSALLR